MGIPTRACVVASIVTAATFHTLAPGAIGEDQGRDQSPGFTGIANYQEMIHESQDPYSLLFKTDIADSLSLSEHQTTEIKFIRTKHSEILVEFIESMTIRRLAPSSGEYKAGLLALQANCRADFRQMLTQAQDNRLWQMAIQLEGPIAVAWPEFRKRFEIDDVQMTAISKIIEEYDADINIMNDDIGKEYNDLQKFYIKNGGDGDKLMEFLAKMTADPSLPFVGAAERKKRLIDRANTAVDNLLTPPQKRAMKAFAGDPIDFEEMRRPGSANKPPRDRAKAEK